MTTEEKKVFPVGTMLEIGLSFTAFCDADFQLFKQAKDLDVISSRKNGTNSQVNEIINKFSNVKMFQTVSMYVSDIIKMMVLDFDTLNFTNDMKQVSLDNKDVKYRSVVFYKMLLVDSSQVMWVSEIFLKECKDISI